MTEASDAVHVAWRGAVGDRELDALHAEAFDGAAPSGPVPNGAAPSDPIPSDPIPSDPIPNGAAPGDLVPGGPALGGPLPDGPDHASGTVARMSRWSLGWVTARDAAGLVGFVNVPWDGGAHAFLLDTAVALRCRRRGIGAALVAVARDEARAAGCAWLHVDFTPDLAPFYLGAGGFRASDAGLIEL